MNPALAGSGIAMRISLGGVFSSGLHGMCKRVWVVFFGLFLNVYMLLGAPGSHHIIMLDTSGSMLSPLNTNAPPRPDQLTRIDAIRLPFKEHIDDLPIGDTLHLYEFNEGLLIPNKVDITLIKEDDRSRAKLWVDNIKIASRIVLNDDGTRTQLGRSTFLYSSLHQVLERAEVLLEKHGQPPSLLIISDGEDTEKDGQFKDMAAVLKKHDATFEKLPSKIFCAIVKFNLGPIKEAFEKHGGAVVLPDKIQEVFKPAISIVADYIMNLQGEEAFIGQTIAFTNRTKTNPPEKLSHLTPDKLEYEWDFGDGSAKHMGRNANHFYKKPGPYTVTLKAINPENTANIREKTIKLMIKPIVPKIQVGKKNACCIHPIADRKT